MRQHRCQCEHIAHFDTTKQTPNGNPAHPYEINYFESYLTRINTNYGTYLVCKDCAKDCMLPVKVD